MKIKKIILGLVILVVIVFTINYLMSLRASIEYLKVLDIVDDISYQRLKADKYFISILTDKDKELIFKSNTYEGVLYPKLYYRVNKVVCAEIRGFNHFVFDIELTLNNYKTIDCRLVVSKGRVIDAFRKEET